jgi:hypothetical protein
MKSKVVMHLLQAIEGNRLGRQGEQFFLDPLLGGFEVNSTLFKVVLEFLESHCVVNYTGG